PLATAAQVPSSQALADEMVAATLPSTRGPVIEFGPGTGAFTDRILDHGVRMHDLILVEQNPDFCRFLRSRYPTATILGQDAMSALKALRGVQADGVISGMPLVQFPRADRIRFIHKCLRELTKPGSKVSQFTYGIYSPVFLGRNSVIQAQSSHRVWRNLWPAVVWTYSLAGPQTNV
ncbi:MAG: rRNA adenine N-6-methyltransferase family protein, partial [Pseudomonadota bacterium]